MQETLSVAGWTLLALLVWNFFAYGFIKGFGWAN
jgi:hypothetical protein